jgi:glycosyltransferase involved in cell wall biosynthesis
MAGTSDPGNPASVPDAVLRNWSDSKDVELLGHVEDMAGLLATVDCVVLPSYREGLPRSLLEAASCGLPLVATDVPGCREVVSNEVTGLLVPPRDAAAVADAVMRLYSSPALARRLGRAARQRVVDRFDEEIVLDATLAVYEDVIAAPE